jgi:hypothetical protein
VRRGPLAPRTVELDVRVILAAVGALVLITTLVALYLVGPPG